MSAQQNMGENLVFIPHQILIFDVEIFVELWGSRIIAKEIFGKHMGYWLRFF